MAKMLIDGQWVAASDGGEIAVLNPSNGEPIDTVPAGTDVDAARAVAAAVRAKTAMAAMPAHKRASILTRVAARMEAERTALVRLLNLENGKTFREVNGWEIDAAIRIFRGYAEEAKRLNGHAVPLHSIPNLENSMAFTVYQPLGVIAVIIPFNYPVELWSHKLGAGLAAGNAVISKPPEDCPLTMLQIARYFEEEGLPAGAHQIVTGYGEVVGAHLAQSPDVQLISMTGSTEVGKLIARAAADTLKKVHLELGGNDATIIMGDVDPEIAADALVAGRFTSGNGQICCAVKRVLIEDSIFDLVRDAVLARTTRLKVGDHTLPDTDVGPLINEKAAKRVEAQVAQAVTDGATLICGGTRQGNFIQPAVLANVNIDSAAFQDEIFGPVLPLVRFKGVDEAIRLANQSRYGLQAAIFTNDMKAAMNAAMKLEVGTVIVNHQSAMRIECLPFGGIKNSGNGREGFMETVKDMSEVKTVVLKDAYSVYDAPASC
jgi:acyl-CoA reductase-like NAD-dependent aldehyde dehydrogenase